MRKKTAPRTALIVTIAAALLWAPLARSESVFDARRETGPAPAGGVALKLAGAARTFQGGMPALYAVSGRDTVETFDVELEDEESGGRLYREIAVVAIVAAVAGYVVYLIVGAGADTAPADAGSDKPTPFARTPLSLSR
jgi:hypothetical protein